MAYDLSVMQGASIIDWFMIANYWSDGVLFTGICILTALIVFAISKYSNQPTLNSFMASCFSGFFVSLMFWLMKFQGVSTVSTYIPVCFATLLSVAIFLKIRE